MARLLVGKRQSLIKQVGQAELRPAEAVDPQLEAFPLNKKAADS
jgi:hypothetical protein